MFRGEEEVVKDLVAVVKGRLDSDSADVVIDVEFVEKVVAARSGLVEVGQHFLLFDAVLGKELLG